MWVKVQTHLERDPRDVKEFLNFVTDEVTNTIHFDDRWWAKNKAQAFKSAITELIIGGSRVTGSAHIALQLVYKGEKIQTELIKSNDWDKELFNIIYWESFGVIF